MGKFSMAVFAAAIISLCALARPDDEKAMKKAPATSPGLEAMKKLVGEWTDTSDHGPVSTSFRVSAGGSIVHETLFPGTEQEMISIYHMDGKDLILTHYCLLGNQPRLKAEDPANGKKLSFKSIGGTNMKMDDTHMGRGVITMIDDDHFEADWCSCTNGKPDEGHKAKFVFTRKKAK